MRNLKEMVEFCLVNYPETRNSDVNLTNRIWVNYFSDKLSVVDNCYVVKLKDLYELPREDNVKRWRAVFQNDKKIYLPTDPEVRKQRRMLESDWREQLGYRP